MEVEVAAAGGGFAVVVVFAVFAVVAVVAVGNGRGVALAARDARTASADGAEAGVVDPCSPASLEVLITDDGVIVPPIKVREAPEVEKVAVAPAGTEAAMVEARVQSVLALKGVAGDASSPPARGLE